MKLYKKPFMATGKAYDITYIDFNHLGLFKKQYQDSKGDLYKNEYYTAYDEGTDTHTGLAILEDRIYTREPSNGLLKKRDTTVTWYATDGSVLETRTGMLKFYTPEKGFKANRVARRNLLDKASLYFYMELVTNAAGDTVIADTHKNDFDAWTTTEQDQYINSTIPPLITKITNAANSSHADYRSYMTASMAAALDSILNIDYDGV